jgi:hypothetical protein
MATTAARTLSFPTLRLHPRAVRRAVLAGSAWGVAMGLALTALKFQDCGVVCLSDVAVNTAIAVTAGILTIGPVAAFAPARP